MGTERLLQQEVSPTRIQCLQQHEGGVGPLLSWTPGFSVQPACPGELSHPISKHPRALRVQSIGLHVETSGVKTPHPPWCDHSSLHVEFK